MRNAVRDFVLSAAADDLPELSDRRVTLADAGTARALRRTWLDTFDWRLYRAGLSLEQVTARGRAELVLSGRDGEVIAAQPAQPAGTRASPAPGPATGPGPGARRHPRGPLTAGDLPAGPVREHIAPIMGVRALMPVARAVSTVAQCRALNADDKTIAQVTIDKMTVSWPRQAVAPTRLRITPLRGYQAQAARLADLLAAAPGVSRSPGQALDAVLACAGRQAGDYTSKPAVPLTPSMPAGAALAAILTALLDTIEANVAGAVRDTDTEFLHDLRIAVRRTRSVLKLSLAALPVRLAAYRGEFKWLGDLTTPARDLDVFLLGYGAMEAGLAAAAPPDLVPFGDHLSRLRLSAQRELARGLRSARFARLASGWRRYLAEAARQPAGPPAGKLAARQIADAHRRVLRDGSQITAASPGIQLHDLRKRAKELRYLVEVYASLHDPADHWQALSELKALQDCLGEFQDTEVQQRAIRDFAEQLMSSRSAPAATLLALGEISGGLAARQRRARDEFAHRFAAFASDRSQARFAALGGKPR